MSASGKGFFILPVLSKERTYPYSLFYRFIYLLLFGILSEFTDVPYLEAIATYNEEQEEVTVFCVNKSLEENAELSVNLMDFDGYKPVEFISMDGYDKKAENTLVSAPVKPHENELPEIDGEIMTAQLKPFSWNVIRLKK